MKAVELKSTVTPGGQIAVPPEVARQIPAGEQLQVVILWEISNLDAAWRAAGRQRFEVACAWPSALNRDESSSHGVTEDLSLSEPPLIP